MDNIKGIDVDNAKKQWKNIQHHTIVNWKILNPWSYFTRKWRRNKWTEESNKQLTLQGDDSYDKKAIIAGGINNLEESSDLLIKQTKEKITGMLKSVCRAY